MSSLLMISGLCIAWLFAAAGYRASNRSRRLKMAGKLYYAGKIESLYKTSVSCKLMSATSILRHAIVARSANFSGSRSA